MKKANLIIRNSFIIATIGIISLFLVSMTEAVVLDKDNAKGKTQGQAMIKSGAIRQGFVHDSQQPQYAPGQIIVKFKKEHGKNLIKRLSADLKIKDNITGVSSIDKLNTKHKVVKMKPVFKALHQKMKETGKDAQALSKEIMNKYPKRTQIIPKDTKPAEGLEDIYVIKSDKDANVLQMVSEYKNDPNVEYAVPNYLAKVNYIPNDPM